MKLTHLDKVLFPSTGFTKGDLIDYYRAVAPALLPRLAGRPLTVARFPDGVNGPGWYETRCRGNPDWLRVAEISGQRYPIVDDLAGLLWIANRGGIELHPLADPAELVLDLDPRPPAGLAECARAALLVRERLGPRATVNTSGRKGLHVRVPCDGPARADRAASVGRVFLDWGPNDPNRSLIAPLSLRATPRPRCATPLEWDELADPGALVFGPRELLQRASAISAPASIQ